MAPMPSSFGLKLMIRPRSEGTKGLQKELERDTEERYTLEEVAECFASQPASVEYAIVKVHGGAVTTKICFLFVCG